MEIVVTARHTDVPDRFRRHATEKLAKVEQLAPRAIRVDVEVSHEANRRQASTCERVELTVRDRGPVIRAEACAADPYSALDVATGKLLERLRRARDRRKVHHGRHAPKSVHDATATLPAGVNGDGPATASGAATDSDAVDHFEGTSLVIREKDHPARPMALDDALYEMELVGHDFFLFVDERSGRPSVVYRRQGYSYGVIRLAEAEAAADAGHRGSGDPGVEARAAG